MGATFPYIYIYLVIASCWLRGEEGSCVERQHYTRTNTLSIFASKTCKVTEVAIVVPTE